jgi:hypothetical protein
MPEIVRKAWKQYGPPEVNTPLSKSPDLPATGTAISDLVELGVLPTPPAAIPVPEISTLGVAAGLPYEVIVKDFSKTNYSSAAKHFSFTHLLGRMAAIHNAKKHDYASNEDCLGNFREARRLGITPLQGIMVRLTDKYTRACNWVRRNGNHAVKDEGLEDTLLGLAYDSCLAILAHNEAEEKAEGEEDHNAKDVHQDQGPANSTGDLSELPEKMSAREEEEEEQVESGK